MVVLFAALAATGCVSVGPQTRLSESKQDEHAARRAEAHTKSLEQVVNMNDIKLSFATIALQGGGEAKASIRLTKEIQHGTIPTGKIPNCNVGANPVDANRMIGPTEALYVLSEDTPVTYADRSNKSVSCTLKRGEEIVYDTTGQRQPWVKRCGNPIVAGIQVRVTQIARNFPEGLNIQTVDECGIGCTAEAHLKGKWIELVRVNFGAGAYWYHGLPGTNITQNQQQQQQQQQQGGGHHPKKKPNPQPQPDPCPGCGGGDPGPPPTTGGPPASPNPPPVGGPPVSPIPSPLPQTGGPPVSPTPSPVNSGS